MPEVLKKRTTEEFLKQYRALGLPGAKKFRRRTRLEQAKHESEVNRAFIAALIAQTKEYVRLIDVLRVEANWTVREVEGKEPEVAWIGESDPLTLIAECERAIQTKFSPAQPQPEMKLLPKAEIDASSVPLPSALPDQA